MTYKKLRIHQGKHLIKMIVCPEEHATYSDCILEKDKSYRFSLNSKTLFSIRPKKKTYIQFNEYGTVNFTQTN